MKEPEGTTWGDLLVTLLATAVNLIGPVAWIVIGQFKFNARVSLSFVIIFFLWARLFRRAIR